MSHPQSSPLPSFNGLSISPTPYPVQSVPSDYPYSGVFGPPAPAQSGQTNRGWTSSPNKRGSRGGIPEAWFESQPQPLHREPISVPSYDSYRRDNSSPPALSPPTSTSSGPASSYYQPTFGIESFPGMGLEPSPPSQMSPYGIPGGYNNAPPYGQQQLPPRQAPQWRGVGNGTGGYTQNTSVSDDDVIPTAIVIKNIPFVVSRDSLLSIIESLGAPLPYAFNYHHDNGVFRGLAFANFRAPEEAASVVAALNGYDVQGRKLRVEYKKVLQPGEKDRIEREKAIKRMKSMQFDNVKPGLGEMGPPPVPPLPLNQVASRGSNGTSHHPSFSIDAADDGSPPHSAASANSDNLPMSLDLNDPSTLAIYNLVYMFKEDRMRDELALSRNLTPTERRIVHLVAQKLGLTSTTQGEGEGKHVLVSKEGARPQLVSSASAANYLSPYSSTPPPQELSPSLRIKKSMPDLRGFNGPVVARDPARSITPQRSSGNLRGDGRDYSSMGASQGRRMNGSHGIGSGTFNNYFGTPVGAPPVPPIPTNLDTTPSPQLQPQQPLTLESPSSQPMRNPRGPVGESRGFGGVNGQTLRQSASAPLRPNAGSLVGRRLSEEDEETPRSREELDI